jgi:hypothetical protein
MKEIAITISKTNSIEFLSASMKKNIFSTDQELSMVYFARLPESELAQPKEIIKVLN